MCRVHLILLNTISSLFFIGCADAFVVPIHNGPRHVIPAPLTLQSPLEQEVELPTTDDLSTTEPNLDPALGSTLHTALDQISDMMMDDSFVQEFPVESVRDLFQNCVDSVQVKTSSIPNAGRGLFAVKDIPSGQIVSFYPVHTLGVTLPDDGDTYSVQHVVVDDDTKHKNHNNNNNRRRNNNDNDSSNNDAPNENESQSDGSYTLYLIGGRPLAGVYVEDLCEGSRPFVDVDLDQPIRPGWMAHFINDGAIVTRPNDTSYYEKSLAAQNCVLVPLGPAPLLVAVTTKPVPKGAELFVSYFYTYWMDVLGATSKEDGSTGEVQSKKPPPKLEVIKQQEGQASREVVNAMEALQNAYAEESHALEVAFDAFLATRDKRMVSDPNDDNEVPLQQKQQHRSSPWLLVPQIVGRLCRRIYNKVFQRSNNNNNRPSFGQ
jgi:hypothetical protein